MSKITIRRLRKDELLEAMRLIVRSGNDLRVKSGRKPMVTDVTEVGAFNYHLYETDPDGNFGAYFEKKMIGFGAAVSRGKQWYLAYLFVDPRFQFKGIGRKLLGHCIDYAKENSESRALCTFPFNETALALYSSFGMMPQSSILEMHNRTEGSEPPPRSLLNAEEDNSSKSLLRINRLEKEIRGYPRLLDWRFFVRDKHHRVFHFFDGAKWVGYSVLYKDRQIAPAGAIEPKYLPDIILASYNIAVQDNWKYCRIWVGGPNAAVYKKLTSLGFRIHELVAFMSTKPYGDFSRYCPAHLGIF